MNNVDSLKYFLTKFLFEPLKEKGLDVEKYAIAGGALRDYLTGDKIKDIDVFCQDKESEDLILKFFTEYPETKVLNQNDLLANFIFKDRWVQVIKGKFYDMSTDDLIKSFDFTICGAMLSGKGELKFLDTFFQDCLAKHLRIHRITFPLSTLERMQKYVKKGYTACNGTLLRISESLISLDLNDRTQNSLEFYPDGTPRFLGID